MAGLRRCAPSIPSRLALATALGVALGASSASADEPVQMAAADPAAAASSAAADPRDERIRQLEDKMQALTDELASLRTQVAVPTEEGLKSEYGLGPAASRIYDVRRGLSIGGYAEGNYRKLVHDKGANNKDRADMLRLVLYTGYKFSENILFNSEIEFEHATTEPTVSSDAGEVTVEFANLDFMLRDWANPRVGLVLMPVGFLNEIHEPPFFYGVSRPEVERRNIPTTWSEMGVGLFGKLGEWGEYRSYVTSGFNAQGIRPSGMRDARQFGNRALAEDFAWVGRIDLTPIEGFLFGGSFYYGYSGQEQTVDDVDLPKTPITLWEVHSQYRWEGFQLRGLFTMTHIGDAGSLTDGLVAIGDLDADEAIGSAMLGGYGEIAYDLLQWLSPGSIMSLSPFFRYEYLDTQWRMPSGFSADGANLARVLTTGLSFKPHPNVVLKTDYRQFNLGDGEQADEVNFGFGLAF